MFTPTNQPIVLLLRSVPIEGVYVTHKQTSSLQAPALSDGYMDFRKLICQRVQWTGKDCFGELRFHRIIEGRKRVGFSALRARADFWL